MQPPIVFCRQCGFSHATGEHGRASGVDNLPDAVKPVTAKKTGVGKPKADAISGGLAERLAATEKRLQELREMERVKKAKQRAKKKARASDGSCG